jgi:hypothetical protein
MLDKHKPTWRKRVVGRLAPALYSKAQDSSRLCRARSIKEPPQNEPPPAEIWHRAGVFNLGTIITDETSVWVRRFAGSIGAARRARSWSRSSGLAGSYAGRSRRTSRRPTLAGFLVFLVHDRRQMRERRSITPWRLSEKCGLACPGTICGLHRFERAANELQTGGPNE